MVSAQPVVRPEKQGRKSQDSGPSQQDRADWLY